MRSSVSAGSLGKAITHQRREIQSPKLQRVVQGRASGIVRDGKLVKAGGPRRLTSKQQTQMSSSILDTLSTQG